MNRGQAYPPDLARYVVEHWPEGQTLRVTPDVLDEALSVAFQASLTSEEARPTRFRLLLTPALSLPESGVPNQGVLRLLFQQTRPLSSEELRRLSPAVPFETSLIGVHEQEGKLRLWGIAHSGPAWLTPAWGGRSLVPNWTFDPIIHVTAPGQIAVRCAGKLVGGLERGVLVDAQMDVFESQWLPALFYQERENVRLEHAALQEHAASPTLVEHSLIGRVSQQMLRRAIQWVRGARHGGMLLFVDRNDAVPPGDGAPQRGPGELRGLRLKYRLEQDEPSHRYRSLLFEILERLATPSSKPSVDWSDFATDVNPRLEQLEHAVFELSRLMANLCAIDGALVLDKRFGILGFGAEVSAELPAPTQLWRALDADGHSLVLDDVENVGTRHRAAYRFAQDNPAGLAVVISHDGGVSFVANMQGRVVFWEQSVSP